MAGCTSSTVISNKKIRQDDFFDEDREAEQADKLGLRLVDYLHLVNTNQIEYTLHE
jgi:hypothetical protein